MDRPPLELLAPRNSTVRGSVRGAPELERPLYDRVAVSLTRAVPRTVMMR